MLTDRAKRFVNEHRVAIVLAIVASLVTWIVVLVFLKDAFPTNASFLVFNALSPWLILALTVWAQPERRINSWINPGWEIVHLYGSFGDSMIQDRRLARKDASTDWIQGELARHTLVWAASFSHGFRRHVLLSIAQRRKRGLCIWVHLDGKPASLDDLVQRVLSGASTHIPHEVLSGSEALEPIDRLSLLRHVRGGALLILDDFAGVQLQTGVVEVSKVLAPLLAANIQTLVITDDEQSNRLRSVVPPLHRIELQPFSDNRDLHRYLRRRGVKLSPDAVLSLMQETNGDWDSVNFYADAVDNIRALKSKAQLEPSDLVAILADPKARDRFVSSTVVAALPAAELEMLWHISVFQYNETWRFMGGVWDATGRLAFNHQQVFQELYWSRLVYTSAMPEVAWKLGSDFAIKVRNKLYRQAFQTAFQEAQPTAYRAIADEISARYDNAYLAQPSLELFTRAFRYRLAAGDFDRGVWMLDIFEQHAGANAATLYQTGTERRSHVLTRVAELAAQVPKDRLTDRARDRLNLVLGKIAYEHYLWGIAPDQNADRAYELVSAVRIAKPGDVIAMQLFPLVAMAGVERHNREVDRDLVEFTVRELFSGLPLNDDQIAVYQLVLAAVYRERGENAMATRLVQNAAQIAKSSAVRGQALWQMTSIQQNRQNPGVLMTQVEAAELLSEGEMFHLALAAVDAALRSVDFSSDVSVVRRLEAVRAVALAHSPALSGRCQVLFREVFDLYRNGHHEPCAAACWSFLTALEHADNRDEWIPYLPYVCLYLIDALWSVKRYDEAWEALISRHAVVRNLALGHVIARRVVTDVLKEIGNETWLLRVVEICQRQGDNSEYRLYEVDALRALGRVEDALAVVDDLIASGPSERLMTDARTRRDDLVRFQNA